MLRCRADLRNAPSDPVIQSLSAVRGATFTDTGRREPCVTCNEPGMDLPQVSTYVRRPPPGGAPGEGWNEHQRGGGANVSARPMTWLGN